MPDETAEPEKIDCGYCSGQGSYTTETWGVKKLNRCQFCGGSGKMSKPKDKG